jgi:hypothetical protein
MDSKSVLCLTRDSRRGPARGLIDLIDLIDLRGTANAVGT